MTPLQKIEIEGKRFVLLEESEYDRLRARGGETELENEGPPLPEPDDRGRFPAIEYARVSLARDLIRRRRDLGLTQQALARLAGIRQETLSRLESGKHTATVRTVDKIMGAVEACQSKAGMSRKRG